MRPRYKLDTAGRAWLMQPGAGPTINALLDSENRAGQGGGGWNGVPRYYLTRPRDPAADTLRWLPLERGESRHLVRSNALAAGAIATNVDRVVGTGLALVAQPDREVLGWSEDQAAEWKATVQREFSLWADSTDCDLRAEQNFYDLQRLVERSSLESGDTFTVLPDASAATSWQPYRLRLQTIEADRVGNPDGKADTADIAGGVKRDAATGAAAAYHVYDQHPGAALLPATGKMLAGAWIDRIGASGRRRILHHFRALRPEQPRGVPYLSPITTLLAQLGRYTHAEILAAVESANLVLLIEAPPGQPVAPAAVFGVSEAQAAQEPIALAPGAVLGLASGEKPHIFNPLRPNVSYEPFVLSIIKQIGVGLGLPFEVLIKLFNASYSASKAALLDAWMRFRAERVWLARSHCQPIYETLLTEAVILGRVKAPGFFRDPLMRWAYCQAQWFGDSMGSINPKDEVEAYVNAIEARLCTRERAEWELFGTDWNGTFPTKDAEQRRLKEADLLPVPKAGAPAPPPPGGTSSASAHDEAFASLAASVAAIAAREHPAPNVSITVEPPAVTIHQGDTTIHTPDTQVTLEATIESPDVIVQPANVTVHAPPALDLERLRIARDPSTGDMTGFERKPQH